MPACRALCPCPCACAVHEGHRQREGSEAVRVQRALLLHASLGDRVAAGARELDPRKVRAQGVHEAGGRRRQGSVSQLAQQQSTCPDRVIGAVPCRQLEPFDLPHARARSRGLFAQGEQEGQLAEALVHPAWSLPLLLQGSLGMCVLPSARSHVLMHPTRAHRTHSLRARST